MSRNWFRQRPFLSLTQWIALLIVIAALFIAFDLNRRGRAGELVGVDEASLAAELAIETTRQVELQATLEYVQSEDYIAAYAREEGGYLLPGERRIVPLVIEATPAATAVPAATPDPAAAAIPWQAWWQLLSDVELPTE